MDKEGYKSREVGISPEENIDSAMALLLVSKPGGPINALYAERISRPTSVRNSLKAGNARRVGSFEFLKNAFSDFLEGMRALGDHSPLKYPNGESGLREIPKFDERANKTETPQ